MHGDELPVVVMAADELRLVRGQQIHVEQRVRGAGEDEQASETHDRTPVVRVVSAVATGAVGGCGGR